MSGTKYLRLIAFRLSFAAVLILPWPAWCDDYSWIAEGVMVSELNSLCLLLISLVCVEVLVVIAEAFLMRWMLGLPTRTAFRWSFLANLASLLLGSGLLFLINNMIFLIDYLFALHSIEEPYSILSDYCLLIPASILIAIMFEYSVLAMLNRSGATKASVLRYCIVINIITVPLVYLAQHIVYLRIR